MEYAERCKLQCVCVGVGGLYFIREHPGISNKEQSPARHKLLERKEPPLEKTSEKVETLGGSRFNESKRVVRMLSRG